MFFDYKDLDLAPPRRERIQMRLCTGCRCVLPALHTQCTFCEESSLIPFLDRRPLLLDRETRNGILDLVDDGASRLTDEILTNEQDFLANQYLPFLTRVLQESEIAERYESMGNRTAYRRTAWSREEILAGLRDLILPPTSE